MPVHCLGLIDTPPYTVGTTRRVRKTHVPETYPGLVHRTKTTWSRPSHLGHLTSRTGVQGFPEIEGVSYRLSTTLPKDLSYPPSSSFDVRPEKTGSDRSMYYSEGDLRSPGSSVFTYDKVPVLCIYLSPTQ